MGEEDQDFLQFVSRVKSITGIDLGDYKEKQMRRRLTSLRNQRGYATFMQYFSAFSKDELLFKEFLERMTINVSEFWRNPNRWDELERVFVPQLLAQNGRIKCWSAACSTGEEPYSLAMILAEQHALHRAKIIASDIDEGVLRKAKEGKYIERSLRELPERYTEKYFKKHDALTYEIDEILQQAIEFEQKNLLVDPFETQFDLIICRNVMIYFTEQAKKKLYEKFAASLKQGGILFVGSTEQIFSPEQYGFKPASTFFYEKV